MSAPWAFLRFLAETFIEACCARSGGVLSCQFLRFLAETFIEADARGFQTVTETRFLRFLAETFIEAQETTRTHELLGHFFAF